MADIDDVIPERLKKWCAEQGHDPSVVPLGDVYPGLRGATASINYSLLPTRARTFFSAHYAEWRDLRATTINDLLSWNGVGISTVRALLAALDRREESVGEATSHEGGPPLGDPASLPVVPPGFAVLRKWARQNASSVKTLGDVLSMDDAALPEDVRAARDAVLGTELVDDQAAPQAAIATLDAFRSSFGPRHLEILDRRRWSQRPDTLQNIAADVGLTRERIRQLQEKAESTIQQRLDGDETTGWLVHGVRTRIGPFATAETIGTVLSDLGIAPTSDHGRMLLDLAGPYQADDNGFVYLADDDQRGKLLGEIQTALGSGGHADHATLSEVLRAAGLTAAADISAFLETVVGLRRFADEWYHWGGSAIDKAAVILHQQGSPMTAEEIAAAIAEGHSFRTVYNGMSQDDRFVRTSKRSWGLREWGMEEYSGIVEEIFERIDAKGGVADLEWLVGDIVSTFDVAENSVRLYLSTLAFFIDDGQVRRRTERDGWPIHMSLRSARATYVVGETVRYHVRVTKDVLRGSGQAIPPGAAMALEVAPGDKRSFLSAGGEEVSVGWRPWSTTGPDLGSIRSLAQAVGAAAGDQLVLIFDKVDQTLTAERLPIGTDAARTLGLLAGATPPNDIASAVADAIGVGRREVKSALRSRGDEPIADMLPQGRLTDDRLQKAIHDLLDQLG